MGQFTEQIEAGTQLASWDMGGDPLGFVILKVYQLLGLSIL
jgi:hypothetical protein